MTAPNSTSSRRSPMPWGLLGMLALVVPVEVWVHSHERSMFQENVPASWKQSARAAQREAVASQVLCFGDSMIKFGVSPLMIRERTGLTTYNLAPYGGPPSASYFLLRRAVDAGARPRAIVADFNLNGIAEPPQQFLRSWREFVTPVEALDLARTTGDWTFLGQLTLGRMLPSLRARTEIRKSLMVALEGGSYTGALDHYVKPLWRNWKIHRGGQLLAANPGFDGKADPADGALFPPKWSSHHASAAYMRRFLELAAERDIPVYWLLPPLAPETQALRERLGVDALFERLVGSVQAKYPNVTVVDARHAGYGNDVFTDPVHLDRHGTAALSAALGEVLSEWLRDPDPAPRWVALPPYPPQPIEVPWEDLDQTRIAIRDQAATRR